MNRNEKDKMISYFLFCVSPLIIDCVKTAFTSQGFEVKEEGSGLDLTFSIKTYKGEARFFIHNLLLEIATVDRDENPLRFDERLLDPRFFVRKAKSVIDSKLRILFHVLKCDDFGRGLKSIESLSGDYERLRIWRIETKPDEAHEDSRTKGGEQHDTKSN